MKSNHRDDESVDVFAVVVLLVVAVVAVVVVSVEVVSVVEEETDCVHSLGQVLP